MVRCGSVSGVCSLARGNRAWSAAGSLRGGQGGGARGRTPLERRAQALAEMERPEGQARGEPGFEPALAAALAAHPMPYVVCPAWTRAQ